MTALVTGFPKKFSAVYFIFSNTKAPTYDGEYYFPQASTQASPFFPLTTLYGKCLISF